jgi:tetratricopeptide (TPR) repeat protein
VSVQGGWCLSVLRCRIEMGFTSWFKRGQPAEAADLRSRLIGAVAAKDLPGLARITRDHREAIAAEFADWKTVPMAMREDPALLEQYGEMLIAVARVLEAEGDASLMQQLQGDPASAPIEQWNDEMAAAAALAAAGRHTEAARLLEALLGRITALRGSAVDFYQPRVLGKLGIARYQSGDVPGALDATRQARDICQRLGDEEGVAAYSSNLTNMGATD